MMYARRWQSSRLGAFKPMRVLGLLIGVACLGLLAWRVLLPLIFFGSLGTFDAPRQVSNPKLDQLVALARDVNLQVPPSAKVLDAFQAGSVERTMYVRFSLPDRDLKHFTNQKLLAGKWQAGKTLGAPLPRAVSRVWRNYVALPLAECRCWQDLVPFAGDKTGGQKWFLWIVLHPEAAGMTTVYLKIAQT